MSLMSSVANHILEISFSKPLFKMLIYYWQTKRLYGKTKEEEKLPVSDAIDNWRRESYEVHSPKPLDWIDSKTKEFSEKPKEKREHTRGIHILRKKAIAPKSTTSTTFAKKSGDNPLAKKNPVQQNQEKIR